MRARALALVLALAPPLALALALGPAAAASASCESMDHGIAYVALCRYDTRTEDSATQSRWVEAFVAPPRAPLAEAPDPGWVDLEARRSASRSCMASIDGARCQEGNQAGVASSSRTGVAALDGARVEVVTWRETLDGRPTYCTMEARTSLGDHVLTRECRAVPRAIFLP